MSRNGFNSMWTMFWHEPLRAERLAAARIAFALALLADQLFQYLPNLAYFFGPQGVAPAGVNDAYLLGQWRWTALFFNTDSMPVVSVVFSVWVAATVMMLLGWKTKAASTLVWLGALCFLNRNPNLKNGGDDTLQVALFLLMISPCGRALSLDSRRSTSQTTLGASTIEPATASMIDPWPIRLFQLQICIVYFTTGIAKLRGYTWWDATSVHNVLNDITTTRWSYAQLPLPFWITAPLTYASVWFEVLFTALVLWKRTRYWTLWFGVLFHLGIFLTLEIGWFSFYTVAMYAVWIPATWWDRRLGLNKKLQTTSTIPG